MKPIAGILIVFWLLTASSSGFAQDPVRKRPLVDDVTSPSLQEILERVERRYDVKGFTALFFQTSILKAMDIRDNAQGKIYIKRPGKMRWEYVSPEPQTIISDGNELWIYRPDDNQVLIGTAPEFFGDGKGASFLSDIRMMRNNFTISMEDRPASDNHELKLVPLKNNSDLATIYVSVSWATFDIEQITTVNTYGDETRIVFINPQYGMDLEDNLFVLDIPEGAEILTIDQ